MVTVTNSCSLTFLFKHMHFSCWFDPFKTGVILKKEKLARNPKDEYNIHSQNVTTIRNESVNTILDIPNISMCRPYSNRRLFFIAARAELMDVIWLLIECHKKDGMNHEMMYNFSKNPLVFCDAIQLIHCA